MINIRFSVLHIKKNTLIATLTLLVFLICAGIEMVYNIAQTGVYAIANKTKMPIYCTNTTEKKVALTFNMAWDETDAKEIADILEREKVKVTFFVVGEFIDQNADKVKIIADAGHEIANHSDKHPHVAQLSADGIIKDLKSCEAKLEKITGKKTTLYRAPYGEYNDTVINAVESQGYKIIQWSIDSVDWKDPPASSITQRVLSNVKEGSIVLFHTGKKNTVEAITDIIKGIKQKGLEIVKVSDLIYKDNYSMSDEGCQIKNQ